jgi:hypothetical protein
MRARTLLLALAAALTFAAPPAAGERRPVAAGSGRRSPSGLQRRRQLVESARVLRALGAADGVNLDGGGSTSLTVGSSLVNRPSDATGERPIGDALLLRASP